MPDLDLSPPSSIFKSDLGRPGWSDADTYRELASLGLLGADWAQTRTISKHPLDMNPDGTYAWKAETNPLLGSHPSIGEVNNYFAASMLAHALIASQLPPEIRKWFQYGTIGLEAPVVGRNKFNFGIGMTF
jgi:hypothetical protein